MTHSMFDRELAREILLQIIQSIDKIERRFWPVDSIADLTDTDRGQERLDAICMKLIAIGESLKISIRLHMAVFCRFIQRLNGKRPWQCETLLPTTTLIWMLKLSFQSAVKKFQI